MFSDAMTASGTNEEGGPARLRGVIAFFCILVLLSFALRIFYAGHLYQDDGLWFTAAEELLRGKALYRDVYFDKPPGLPLLYAGLFRLFGTHILTIRLFMIVYAVAVAAVLYGFASRLHGRRAGRIAAAIFVVFSTTHTTGHMQGLNTDFLMTLPYSAAAWLFVESALGGGRSFRVHMLAAAAGGLAGVASQINPKGALVLLLLPVAALIPRAGNGSRGVPRSRLGRVFVSAGGGFVAGLLPFLVYLALTRSLSTYWLYVWEWGGRYAGYYPFSETLTGALRHGAAYLALNNLLLVGLVAVIWSVVASRSEGGRAAGARRRADLMLLAWLGISFVGLSTGGRFFGHYFFQVLPPLCIVGARGLLLLLESPRLAMGRVRFAVLALLVLGLGVTVVRYHLRTAELASDWITGARSESTRSWFHERLKVEERMVAAEVREVEGGADAAESLGLEAMRCSTDDDAERTLFVWGYRPEIYFWSGLEPASRYLSSQPLTGVPADVHYFGGQHAYVLDEATAGVARRELARELDVKRPKYIIDELGFFNAELAMSRYAELDGVLQRYRYRGTTGRFIVYRRRDRDRRERRRNRRAEVPAAPGSKSDTDPVR